MTTLTPATTVWGGQNPTQNEVTMMVVATHGAGSAVLNRDEQQRDWRKTNGRR